MKHRIEPLGYPDPPPPEFAGEDEIPPPPSPARRVARWTAQEKTTIARALAAGKTAEECTAQLTGRTVAAVKAQAERVIEEGKAQSPPVELPPFKRTVPGVDWEALRAVLDQDRRGEV